MRRKNARGYHKKMSIFVILLALPATAAILLLTFFVKTTVPTVNYTVALPNIIIDPGHGGEDGGAVGYNGLIEKDINLQISLKVQKIFEANGFHVIMTRDDDRAIYDDGLTKIREQKRSDMNNRLKIIKADKNAIFVSVHQNLYQESKYSGAQIFYSPNGEYSEQLARRLQENFKALLQPDNNREHKKAGKELFLLYQAKIPAVLVECGFISNPEESQMLQEEAYQQDVAFVIYSGVLDYINQNL